MTRKVYMLFRLLPILTGVILMFVIFFSAGTVRHDALNGQSSFIDFEITREPRIGSARISTLTGDGSAIIINADKVNSRFLVTESHPISLNFQNPIGHVEFQAGDMVWFSGVLGEIDEIGDFIRLKDSVALRTSNGYEATMKFLRSNLESTYIQGKGDVEGFGPLGTISSNKVEIFPDAFEKGSYFLKFTGDVFVVYWPED